MWFETDLALDYVSSLAVLAILAWGYGLVQRGGVGRLVAPIALGLGFGLVAVLQMNAAFQPVGGFLIDLRLVPVGLAGAFLGRRGLAACVVVALAGRYQIGGIGMYAGMTAICLSGLAGVAWDRATRARGPRGALPILILGLVTLAGVLPAMLLPAPLSGWFLSEALLILALLHLLAMTALAALLEHVRQTALIDLGTGQAGAVRPGAGTPRRPRRGGPS